MATRPKANAKVVAGLKAHRELLTTLLPGPTSPFCLKADGLLETARALHIKGLVNLTPDICTILPDGRTWLKEYG